MIQLLLTFSKTYRLNRFLFPAWLLFGLGPLPVVPGRFGLDPSEHPLALELPFWPPLFIGLSSFGQRAAAQDDTQTCGAQMEK